MDKTDCACSLQYSVTALSCVFVSIRKVAKKVFIGNLQPNETVDASNEANLLRHLDHAAIVKFYDSFVEADFFYIITEYCEVLQYAVNSCFIASS